VATYAAPTGKVDVVSRRSYRIQFETGRATVTPEGERQLAALKDSLAITGLFIQVDGYTDDVGSDAVNRPLSLARAAAIQGYVQRLAPESFPSARFAVAGHGSLNPVATNATAEGRAANRRVEISLLER
jgi:OmpA-OmpF porin, OOP family